jgi:hypothetical protein
MKKGTSEKTLKAEKTYEKPSTRKHEPVKVVQGSGGCNGLYYTALYKYFG